MEEELTIDNAERIKFQVVSPIFSIETLKHMRAGAKGDAKAVVGSKTLLAHGQYLFGRRALKRVVNDGQVVITSLK